MPKERLSPHQKKMLDYKKETREAKLEPKDAANLAENRISKQESHKKLRSKMKQMIKGSPADSSSNLTAASLESLQAPKPAHHPQVPLGDVIAPKKGIKPAARRAVWFGARGPVNGPFWWNKTQRQPSNVG